MSTTSCSTVSRTSETLAPYQERIKRDSWMSGIIDGFMDCVKTQAAADIQDVKTQQTLPSYLLKAQWQDLHMQYLYNNKFADPSASSVWDISCFWKPYTIYLIQKVSDHPIHFLDNAIIERLFSFCREESLQFAHEKDDSGNDLRSDGVILYLQDAPGSSNQRYVEVYATNPCPLSREMLSFGQMLGTLPDIDQFQARVQFLQKQFQKLFPNQHDGEEVQYRPSIAVRDRVTTHPPEGMTGEAALQAITRMREAFQAFHPADTATECGSYTYRLIASSTPASSTLDFSCIASPDVKDDYLLKIQPIQSVGGDYKAAVVERFRELAESFNRIDFTVNYGNSCHNPNLYGLVTHRKIPGDATAKELNVAFAKFQDDNGNVWGSLWKMYGGL